MAEWGRNREERFEIHNQGGTPERTTVSGAPIPLRDPEMVAGRVREPAQGREVGKAVCSERIWAQ